MKIKVSDYISNFLYNNGVKDIFTVVGGGAMYLNDSFGHNKNLHCTYFHHEQAASMAAEAYARVNNEIAAVCVTSGPGATNAITGVLCGWMSSIPMLIISGQARYSTTIHTSNVKLRTRGIQEFDITGSIKNMTKYCELISDPNMISYCLEKALFLAKEGKQGPCWLDIPLDVQSAIIDTRKILHYKCNKNSNFPTKKAINDVIYELKKAQRPVILAGNGIRLSESHNKFLELVDKLNIPVVTTVGSVDAISYSHPLFVGISGTTGSRAGNFAIQNSDLVLSLGSRLSFSHTGFNSKDWARNAYKIVNNIDINELNKSDIDIDLKIDCSVSIFIDLLLSRLEKPLLKKSKWIDKCLYWKERYPVVQNKHYADDKPNIYVFYKELSTYLTNKDILLVSAGTARVVGSQASMIKEGMRFITNSSTASMGYDLPSAIGTCIANNRKRIVVCTGDGSIQMNIQELQTIVQNRLPIIIFVLNNKGYHSIRMTQSNYFDNSLVGVGEESGDLSFPDLSKLAKAYGIKYLSCHKSVNLTKTINKTLNFDGVCLCELFLSIKQKTEPKVSSKKLKNGQFKSALLEDMTPFLSRKEFNKNMKI